MTAVPWSCPRCAAPPRTDCRTRSGRPHRSRRRLQRDLDTAVRAAALLPDVEQLRLADAIATSPPPRLGDDPRPITGPSSAADQMLALRTLRSLQGFLHRWTTAMASGPVETGEVADQMIAVTARLDEVNAVLREIDAGLPTDARVLPSGRPPTPAELRRARERGDALALESAFARRLTHQHQNHPGAPSTRWTITTSGDGHYEARSQHHVRVRAWAALPSALEAELASWSTPPSRVQAHYPKGRPEPVEQTTSMTNADVDRAPGATDIHDQHAARRREDYDDPGDATRLHAAVSRLRAELAPTDVADFFARRVRELNATAPQLPELDPEPGAATPTRTWSGAHTWIDPRTIVHTVDHDAWGTIDREAERSGSTWIPNAITDLITTTDAAGLLRRAGTGGTPVQLQRLPGPAGPLHTVAGDGTHRVHLWRILDLPALYAYVHGVDIPLQLTPGTVVPVPDRHDHRVLETVAAIWAGLHRKGIVRGTLRHPGDLCTRLDLDWVPALWLLYPPDQAAAYGRRYSEVYPGAWEGVGIPSTAFDTAQTWLRWAAATGDRPREDHRGGDGCRSRLD